MPEYQQQSEDSEDIERIF